MVLILLHLNSISSYRYFPLHYLSIHPDHWFDFGLLFLYLIHLILSFHPSFLLYPLFDRFYSFALLHCHYSLIFLFIFNFNFDFAYTCYSSTLACHVCILYTRCKYLSVFFSLIYLACLFYWHRFLFSFISFSITSGLSRYCISHSWSFCFSTYSLVSSLFLYLLMFWFGFILLLLLLFIIQFPSSKFSECLFSLQYSFTCFSTF